MVKCTYLKIALPDNIPRIGIMGDSVISFSEELEPVSSSRSKELRAKSIVIKIKEYLQRVITMHFRRSDSDVDERLNRSKRDLRWDMPEPTERKSAVSSPLARSDSIKDRRMKRRHDLGVVAKW